MVSKGLNHPQECFLQVWSWLVDKKPVKTPPVLQDSSWSLGGHGCSWDIWRWCQKGWTIPRNVSCKFEVDWLTKSLSRLLLSSKFPPGVLEDMVDPNTPPCGVKRSNLVLRMFGESFMKIGALKGHQDSTCPPSVLLESWRTWRFLIPLLVVSKDPTWSLECLVKISWRLVH